MYGWEERLDKVLIESLVLTHLIDLSPLVFSHLFTNHLSSQFLTREVTTSKLNMYKSQYVFHLLYPWNVVNDEKMPQLELTPGLVCWTEHARKASRYVKSRTPSAFNPLTPSAS